MGVLRVLEVCYTNVSVELISSNIRTYQIELLHLRNNIDDFRILSRPKLPKDPKTHFQKNLTPLFLPTLQTKALARDLCKYCTDSRSCLVYREGECETVCRYRTEAPQHPSHPLCACRTEYSNHTRPPRIISQVPSSEVSSHTLGLVA